MHRLSWLLTMVLLAVFSTAPFILIFFMGSAGALFAIPSNYFFSRPNTPDTDVHEIRIVGDIMLGRHVETLMKQYGAEYPYQNLTTEPGVVWVGNFESSVPDQHIQTPNYRMNFSVNKAYVDALKSFGFAYLSLANNHSYDYGAEGFSETVANLSDFNVFGHPKSIEQESITYTKLGQVNVGLIAINNVNGQLDRETLSTLLYTLGVHSDVQIAYIHWGEEYQVVHNQAQEELAHELIDNGIDMIIGHHPHVVQDVAVYKDKPIFYSLGNFIFDQYFDPAVKEGLMIALSLNETGELSWDLVPISSKEMAAAPRIMVGEERDRFLKELARRSEPGLYVDILDGNLTLAY